MERKMSQKEVQIIMTIVAMFIIIGIYVWHNYNKFIAGNPDIINDQQFWGKHFLMLVPIMAGTLIAFFILFAILKKAVTKKNIETLTDEMDRLIELKAIRISRLVNSIGFLLAFGSLAIGKELWVFFTILISSCFVAALAESIAKIYHYRKGV
jgi:hypothetical protein